MVRDVTDKLRIIQLISPSLANVNYNSNGHPYLLPPSSPLQHLRWLVALPGW